MASTLVDANNCCTPCESPVTVQIPGPAGTDGADGADGADGISPFTTFTAIYTIPAELGNAVATVADTSWMVIGQILYGSRVDGSVHAFLEVVAIGGATSVTLQNLEDAATSAYLDNSAPGSTLNVGSLLIPAGLQGPTGLLSGAAAGGHLKGTYPNPTLAIPNTKGGSVWGNGTDAVEVTAGTNGHMLAYDSTDAEGIKSFKALPLTGDTDLADNRIMRTDGATGLPVPGQPSKVEISDTGAIAAVGSAVGVLGNVRGTNAIDLQVARGVATQVASGNRSFIGGGENNTASSTESVVVGGDSNIASTNDRGAIVGGSGNQATGTESFVGGGQNNVASGTQSVVAGGDANVAGPLQESAVCGGTQNEASGAQSFVGGGNNNTASGLNSTVAGGLNNTATAQTATVGGGDANTASAEDATVGGGQSNTASAQGATIPGGMSANADKHGELAHASGAFATAGDCQTSELQWRITTTDATANVQAFLDGASLLATIPNNTSWVFDILHIGRSSAGVTAAWRTVGAIQNNAGTTALVAAVTNTLIADGTGGTWGAVGNVPVVDADNVNDALRVRVTGAGATTIRWTSIARLAQLTH